MTGSFFFVSFAMGPFQSFGAFKSPQVSDQKYFAAPKKLNKFSLATILTLDGFGRQSETLSVSP